MAQLTILEFHRILNQELQSMGFFTSQGLETEEIDLQINAQIDLFVEAVIDKFRGRIPKIGVEEGFQANQIRLDDLRTIHVKDLSRNLTVYDTNAGVKFDLPDDYSHHIKTKVTWSIPCKDEKGKDSTLTGNSQIRVTKSEDIEDARNSVFYKTVKENPLAEIAGNTVYIYTSGFSLGSTVKLDYIRKPVVVKYAKDGSGNYDSGNSVHCDLPHTVHRTIIKMTAIHISTIIESNQQKVQNLQQETV